MKKAKKILLIDDDIDDQLYFKDAINEISKSLECKIANNGREAIKQINVPPPPDLIFLDLNMPVMNGYECLSFLKREDLYKNIPVVIFTTSQSVNDIEKCRKIGAELFFTKPSNFNTLCAKLDSILDMDFTKMQFTL